MSEMPNIPRSESFLHNYPIKEIEHLVHLIHESWLPSPAGNEAYRNNGTNNSYRSFMCSATEIQKAGIQFLKMRDESLFDIKFENQVMKILSLEINDSTKTIFQNLIVYEQCSRDINLKHVTDYVQFLKSLINSSKDAELLCCRGIISNYSGDDEVIAALFNKLCDGTIVLGERFYYREVFYKVKLYCSRRRNKWMTNLRWRNEKWKAWLRQNYFSTRWAIISFVGAVVLLLLMLLQALFAVLSYYHKCKVIKYESRCSDCGIEHMYQDGCSEWLCYAECVWKNSHPKGM